MKTNRHLLKTITIFLFTAVWIHCNATNLVEALPLTNKIVMLKFVDGEATYHSQNQPRTNDAVSLFPGGRINQTDAAVTGIYSITSSNDANYSSSKNPVSIGVNIRSEQLWAFYVPDNNYIQTAFVYLFLSTPLVNGKSYTFTVNSTKVNGAASTASFVFDTKMIRSEAVHVNNLGYVPSAPRKCGYVYHWMGDKGGMDLASADHITSSTNRVGRVLRVSDKQVVYTCPVTFRTSKTQAEFGQWGTPDNNFSGSDVWECDFSGLNTPGEYVLSVDDIGVSFPFSINTDIYKEHIF